MPADAIHATMCLIIWFINFFSQQILDTLQPKHIIHCFADVWALVCVLRGMCVNVHDGLRLSGVRLPKIYMLRQALPLTLEFTALQTLVSRLALRIPCAWIPGSGITAGHNTHLTLTVAAVNSNSCPQVVYQVLYALGHPSWPLEFASFSFGTITENVSHLTNHARHPMPQTFL